MAKHNNRTCIICGRGYRFCGSCREDVTKPSWYNIFDSKRCNDIYEICVSYRDNVLDIKEAYEKISKLDLSDLENFASSTKSQIEEIMKYKSKSSVVKQVETKDVVLKANDTKNSKEKK